MKHDKDFANNRFFYHSFPRRFQGDASAEISKGLEILASVRDIGFVLTPEITEWREPQTNGTLSKPWKVIQKRCCFTELSPQELKRHSETFGSFCLEFDVRTFRQLGGIPVWYLPRASADDIGLESLPVALFARMGEIQTLLNRLSEIGQLVSKEKDKSQLLGFEKKGAKGFLRTSLGGAEDVITLITRDTQSVDILQNALRVISGFFYPAEDLRYTGLLAYYQQREWRFVANMSKEGFEVNRDPTSEEVDRLLQIDPAFFGKEMEFFTGVFRRVDQCRIYSELNGQPIYRFARRIIVPNVALEKASALFRTEGDPPVVPGGRRGCW